MPSFILLLAAATALAQVPRQTQSSNTTEDLRGVSAVSTQIAWASGTHGTYLRTTDGGRTWIPAHVPNASTLDFRGVVAFSADEAFLMSAGPGDQSRIYHTADAGQHWQLQLTAANPKSFFDSIAFWDRTHGIVLGDPVPDDSGQLKFQLLITEDGQSWTPLPSSQLPIAVEGEGAFAASNTAIAIINRPDMNRPVISRPVIPSEARDHGLAGTTSPANSSPEPPTPPWKSGASAPRRPAVDNGASAPDPNLWFATGGKAARVFHSPDRGQTWQVFETPIAHGPESAGIFSIAFRDPLHGAIAGGDYKHPDQDGPNLAFTNDGGKTWTISQIFPQSYYSALAYDAHLAADAFVRQPKQDDTQAQVRLFLATTNSMYDFRPPRNPTRISPPKKSEMHFNAVSPYPTGGAIFVGPKGSIATLP